MLAEKGYIRVEQAFSPVDAEAMSDLLWSIFSREFGIERSDPSTWDRPFRKRPLLEAGTSLFDDLLTDKLAAVVDELLGAGAWEWPSSWGDFLITFPNAEAWALPHAGWHEDWGFDTSCEPLRFFKTFAYLNRVEPGGGGTLVVEGSHLLAGRYGEGRIVDEGGTPIKGSQRLYEECHWLRDLTSPGDDRERRQRFMEEATEVDGARLRVVELSGEPGDVVIIHPWLIHASAPNAAASPRFMRAPVFVSRAGLA